MNSPQFKSVIGPTGVGKSTFIDYVTVGEPIPEESRASTTAVAVHRTNLGTPPQSFAFVDTPGFDNAINMGSILWFIKQAQKRGFQLDRTLYLHPVLEDPKSLSPEEKLHFIASRYGIQLPEATFVEITWSLKIESIRPRGVRDHLRSKGCDTVQFGNSMASAHRIVLCLEASHNPTAPKSRVGPLSEPPDSTNYRQIPPVHPVGESQDAPTTTVHKSDVDGTPDLVANIVSIQVVLYITQEMQLKPTFPFPIDTQDPNMSSFPPKSHVASMHGQGGKAVRYQSTYTSVQDPSAEKRWDGPNMEYRDPAQYAKRGEGPQVTDPRRVPSMDTEHEKSRNPKPAAARDTPATNIEDDTAGNDQNPNLVMKSQNNKVMKGKGAQAIESRGAPATTEDVKAIAVPKEGPAGFEDIPPTDKVVL
ncbi:hypothetical protein FRC16_001232 [Serendipita sp. 398]|nr:hypothetical protein FRC16_001232 [Serendipita sp. 398]